MICPKCQKKMQLGKFRYGDNRNFLKWASDAKRKGPLGIKVSATQHIIGLDENGAYGKDESYFCPNCMFIITPIADQSKVKKTDEIRLEDEVINQARQELRNMEEKEKSVNDNHYFTDKDL